MNSIRLFLLDNEDVFRQGLAKLIDEQANMVVVHQSGDGEGAVEKAAELRPDVVLIDSQTAETGVVSLVAEIIRSSPATKVALFAHAGTDIALVDAIKAGARACLAKNISAADLVKSIELVSSGRIVISPAFADRFLQEIGSPESQEALEQPRLQTILSDREIQIARLIAQGATNNEIAAALFIAENTVKVHVKNILQKLELRNRQQVVAYAVLRNWVTLDSTEEGGGIESSKG